MRPAALVAVLVALATALAASPLASAQNGTDNASNGTADEPPPYLQGTRDPSNNVWWYAALAVLFAIFIAALWFMGVLPR